MGRQLRRVALDFKWPLHEVWSGFLNPHYHLYSTCRACGGSGSSAAAKRYEAEWYGTASFDPASTGSAPFETTNPAVVAQAERTVKSGNVVLISAESRRLVDHYNSSWSHHLSQEDVDALVAGKRLHGYDHRPTAAEVNLWSLNWLGHDALNMWTCVEARCARNGESHLCPSCNGEGGGYSSPEARRIYESWEPTEPPVGDGWQLWETVSEGSPISPVCATAEELARWLAEHDGDGHSYDSWMKFIQGGGWAPSCGSLPGRGFVTGVEWVNAQKDLKSDQQQKEES